ncbi:MAG: hypothetical protein WC820_01470, partial [Spirochaetales bacterium]
MRVFVGNSANSIAKSKIGEKREQFISESTHNGRPAIKGEQCRFILFRLCGKHSWGRIKKKQLLGSIGFAPAQGYSLERVESEVEDEP